MPNGPGDSGHELKRAILREVYEQNLRIAERAVPSAPPPRRRPADPSEPVRTSRLPAFLSAGALVLASLLYLAISGSQPSKAARVGAPVEARSLVPEDGVLLDSMLQGRDQEAEAPSLAGLFGLEVETIVIDPGHGGRDPGTSGRMGIREKDVTLDVARRLRRRLEASGRYRILLTRDEDVKLGLKDRVTFANREKADLFVSIHVNYLPVEKPLTAIETYYFGMESDARTLDLVERENQDSEYGLGDFKDMIERIGETMRLQESRKLAESIQHSLYQNLRTQNAEIKDWGVKSAPFVVLLQTEMPSILAEISCLNSLDEEEKLRTAAYRERLAAFLEEGIIRYLEDRSTSHPSDELTYHATREGQSIH